MVDRDDVFSSGYVEIKLMGQESVRISYLDFSISPIIASMLYFNFSVILEPLMKLVILSSEKVIYTGSRAIPL